MTVRKRPTQARSRVKFEKVLDSAANLLVDEGIDYLTTPRIAEASGVTVGSIYQWFPNKESILNELYQRWLDEALEDITKFSEDHQHVTNKSVFFTDMLRYHMSNMTEHDHRLSTELTNALRVNKALQVLDTIHEARLVEKMNSDLIRFGIIPYKGKTSKDTARRLTFLFSTFLTLMDMISRSDSCARDHFIDYAAEVIDGIISQIG